MATRISAGALLTSPLAPTAVTPLFRQLYEELRRGILNGTLAPGVRLPATRPFAVELGVARNTVVNAYEQLLAAGYLEGKMGSGTHVRRTMPEEMLRVRPANEGTRPDTAATAGAVAAGRTTGANQSDGGAALRRAAPIPARLPRSSSFRGLTSPGVASRG